MEPVELGAFTAILCWVSDAEKPSLFCFFEKLAWNSSRLFPFVDEGHDLLVNEPANGAAPLGVGVIHVRAGWAEAIKCQSHARDRGRAPR